MEKIMKKLFLLCACLLISTSFISSAQAQKINVGVFDEDKLAEGYTKYREAVIAFDDQTRKLDSQLEARELLQGDALKRFDILVAQEKRSAAEETELDNLVKAGGARRAEFIGLIGKNNRSKDDEKRLEELNTIMGGNALTLSALQDALFSQLKQKQDRIDTENTDRAQNVIERIASEKKLILVWSKRAVIWSAPTVDITADILAALNKG